MSNPGGSKRAARTITAIIATLTLGIAACEGRADVESATPPRAGTISVDTVWSANPADTILDIAFGAIERGNSILFENQAGKKVLPLFDSAGNRIRLVGGAGDGSGAYSNIQSMSERSNGEVYVFDRRRITVLDSTLAVVRTIDLPFRVDHGEALSDGSVVVFGPRDPGQSSHALRLLDSGGRIVQAFDSILPGAFHMRVVARARGNTVWVHEMNSDTPSYLLRRWDVRSGQVVQSIQDTPDWFRQLDPQQLPSETGRRLTRPPPPRIFDVREGSGNILWIISNVPSPDWATARERRDIAFDGVLEVRHAETGALLAIRKFSEYLTGFTSAGNVIMFSTAADGRPIHTVLRVALEPNG